MTNTISREIQLVSRPQGIPTADNFTIAQTELKPLQEGQVLVRNLYISVDPYMRGRMNEGKSYVPPFKLVDTPQPKGVGIPASTVLSRIIANPPFGYVHRRALTARQRLK